MSARRIRAGERGCTTGGPPADRRAPGHSPPPPFLQRHFAGLTTWGFQQTFDEQAAQGWGPMLVTATGPATAPLIAAIFTSMKPVPYTRMGITAAELRELNGQAMQRGTILQSVDAYGTPADTRYIAVWHPNTTGEAWNSYVELPLPVGWRPLNLAILPSLAVMKVAGTSTIEPWVLRVNMTSAGYQAEFDKLLAQGMAPLRVSGQVSSLGTRFAAVFATRE